MDYLISLLVGFLLSFFGGTGIPVEEQVPAPVTVEVVEVIDGDTIRVMIEGEVESVRYIGIDTPEPYQNKEPDCYSLEASARNKELVEGKVVTLVSDVEDRDKYDRLLRYIYVDDIFVNEVLVKEGHAKTLSIPPNTQYSSVFKSATDKAREEGLGLWSVCE